MLQGTAGLTHKSANDEKKAVGPAAQTLCFSHCLCKVYTVCVSGTKIKLHSNLGCCFTIGPQHNYNYKRIVTRTNSHLVLWNISTYGLNENHLLFFINKFVWNGVCLVKNNIRISISAYVFAIFILMFKRLQQQNFPIHSETCCCNGICVNSGLIVMARLMTKLSLERA